jgi:hypothetical protein
MGQPAGGDTPALLLWWERAPGELKHLSTPRKRKDSPSSGERTGRSPNRVGVRSLPALPIRGWTRCREETADSSRANFTHCSRRLLERAAGAGESPVGDAVGGRVLC